MFWFSWNRLSGSHLPLQRDQPLVLLRAVGRAQARDALVRLDEVRERRADSVTRSSPPRTRAPRRCCGRPRPGPSTSTGRSRPTARRASLSAIALLSSVCPTAPPIGARISWPNGAGSFSACSTTDVDRLVGQLVQPVDLEVLAHAVRVAGVEHLLQRDVRHRLHHVDDGIGRLAQRPRSRLLAVLDRPDVAEHDAHRRLARAAPRERTPRAGR